MSDYVKCKTCGEWGWTGVSATRFGGHKCAPVWEARIFETKYENDWTEVHGTDAEDAAAKFAEQYDQDGEYSIISYGSAEVEVRKMGETETTLCDISAESVPEYRAYARSHKGMETP